jgi:phosphate transport system permease protein
MHESIIQGLLFFCGFASILTTLGIVIVLGNESITLFTGGDVSIVEFFTSTDWNPAIGHFGVLPLLNATVITSATAMFVAIPLGMGSAIYLSEYASSRTRKIIKPILEVLAGIPTVVYGYFALTFMTPVLKAILGNETVNFQNTASAGLVMGVMILPLVASMSEDALSAVPQALREAAFGLGSTKFETSVPDRLSSTGPSSAARTCRGGARPTDARPSAQWTRITAAGSPPSLPRGAPAPGRG